MALNLKFKTVQGKQFELSFEDSTKVGRAVPGDDHQEPEALSRPSLGLAGSRGC